MDTNTVSGANDTFVFDLATTSFGNDTILDFNFDTNKDTLRFDNLLDIDGNGAIDINDFLQLVEATDASTSGNYVTISVYSDPGIKDASTLLGSIKFANISVHPISFLYDFDKQNFDFSHHS
jgi:hypothetical protein